MRWNIETSEERKQRLSKWRRWFAWYPVKVYNHQTKRHQKVWFESIWRRGYGNYYWFWDYSVQSYVELNQKEESIEMVL